MRIILSFLVLILLSNCQPAEQNRNTAIPPISTKKIDLQLPQAERLALLPLKCIATPLPYKSGIVIAQVEDLQMPQIHHAAFYGCFDWHSAVHGHWSLVYLMKRFPELSKKEDIIKEFDKNLTPENIATEIAYFSMNKYTKSFERTYGWAWLLKLSEEPLQLGQPKGQAMVQDFTTISRTNIRKIPKLFT